MVLSAYGFNPLTINDKPLIDSILLNHNTMLSAYSFTSNYIWRDHFNFYWGLINSYLCLFAQYGACIYMPVPPVLSENPVSNPPSLPFTYLFNIMDTINNNKTVSRIENIDDAWIQSFTDAGYRIKAGEPEYLYLRESLSSLKGDSYKSKRAMCNYFEKRYKYSYEPFERRHATQCIELFDLWREERAEKEGDPFYNAMLEDSSTAHREAVHDYDALDLKGRVVLIDHRVEGYIFGFARNRDVYYILLEVANPGIRGLAQFIFRAFCREMEGYTYINALGDSGLENLRRVKLSYRPVKLAPSFTACRD